MRNLVTTYSALRRHQDALVMKEKTLEFQRRVLPENHPDIRIACLSLGISYAKASDLHRALLFAREALRVFKATLPPSHPHVEQAQQLVQIVEDEATRRA